VSGGAVGVALPVVVHHQLLVVQYIIRQRISGVCPCSPFVLSRVSRERITCWPATHLTMNRLAWFPMLTIGPHPLTNLNRYINALLLASLAASPLKEHFLFRSVMNALINQLSPCLIALFM
jgi:hypothetical protein